MTFETITFESIIELAKRLRIAPDVTLADVRTLAAGVCDLLAEGAPCGYAEPVPNIVSREVNVPDSWCAPVPTDDARAMGRMLFAAADEADGL